MVLVMGAADWLTEFWDDEIKSGLDLSEQYFMETTKGINDQCEGGDASAALNYFGKYARSVELESNYKYDASQKESRNPPLIISSKDYLVPIKV